MQIGYVRLSTLEQNPDWQRDALNVAAWMIPSRYR